MMENEIRKCEQCGAELPEDSSVCPECGATVTEAPAEPAEELVPAAEPAEEQVPAADQAEEAAPAASEEQPVEPAEPAKESRRERKQREKEEARLEKERAKQAAKEAKAEARAARKAERRYRNIPTVIILVLILIALTAGLGFLGWEYIGARSTIDSLTAENRQLVTEEEELTAQLAQKEDKIGSLQTEIEEKLGLITQGDAKAEEYAELIGQLKQQAEADQAKTEELLKLIAEKEPLGGAVSGDFRADRAVILAEDGESIPLTFSALYEKGKTAVDYTFEKGTRNIDTVSLSESSIAGESALITLRVRKKSAEEDALALLKFTNDQSDDFFYMIIVVK